MNGIKMSDCKFYVNEEERTIVCVIPNTRDMVENFISEHFCWNDFNTYLGVEYEFMKQLEMPHSFMGKAVCAAEDEWNEELGRMIAFSRAKDKCYKSFFRRANMLVNMIDSRLGDMITQLNVFGAKLSNKKDALEQQIEERITK